MSVIGYGDMPYAAVFNPGATTIHLPRKVCGQLACWKLMAVLEGEPGAQDPVILRQVSLLNARSCVRRTQS
ncbi:hypothetical protein [uncultured Roseibium sp.]|uniref:hypothetical protein n=1 Tax=uncultured Roseibium sp. TaxID=1936171 RepID=UPI00345D6E31